MHIRNAPIKQMRPPLPNPGDTTGHIVRNKTMF